MPSIGDKARAREIGKKGGKGDSQIFIWVLCPNCQEGRWVSVSNLKRSRTKLCRNCFRCQRYDKASAWKGGRVKSQEGYIWIRLQLDDFFYSMTGQNKYVAEHRLVMAKALGRNLHRWELVHHKNHIRDDNRIENLQLISSDRHNQLTLLETRIIKLEDKVEEQAKEIRLLQWQLRGGRDFADVTGEKIK